MFVLIFRKRRYHVYYLHFDYCLNIFYCYLLRIWSWLKLKVIGKNDQHKELTKSPINNNKRKKNNTAKITQRKKQKYTRKTKLSNVIVIKQTVHKVRMMLTRKKRDTVRRLYCSEFKMKKNKKIWLMRSRSGPLVRKKSQYGSIKFFNKFWG